jgi:uncharacterized protein YPO0396
MMNEQAITGYRLNRVEILNWGTFHQKVWSMELSGANSLLTGDIGSGKSTLIDALTTLLVPRPSNHIVFNKAAGAESAERTIASYMLGNYKNEIDCDSNRARAVALRDERSYTVLLAWFYNAATRHGVCLVQVFWFRDKSRQIERMYIVAERNLSICDWFRDFDDIVKLRQKLRQTENVKVCDSMKEYANDFRRLTGISNDNALDLLYQTVSMKTVSDLTAFVRHHMLDSHDTESRVDDLCRGFDDLDRAYAEIVKARTQIEMLTPLVSSGLKFKEKEGEVILLRQSRELLDGWRSNREISLRDAEIAKLAIAYEKICKKQEASKRQQEKLLAAEDGIKEAIAMSGGSRLQAIEHTLLQLGKEYERKHQDRDAYQRRVAALELPMPNSDEQFIDQRRILGKMQKSLNIEIDEIANHKIELRVAARAIDDQVRGLRSEITSLTGRQSNIPSHLLKVRQRMCEALGVTEERIPFVGELLCVAESEKSWEGAIERVLHNFSLSLLVEDGLYEEVSEWVDQTHLHGKVVYFRVSTRRHMSNIDNLASNNLAAKLAIKDGTPFHNWLWAQLTERFNYICCESLAEFRRYTKAVTRQGQIKAKGERHEKDDRYAISDRSRYVLGWSNKAKLQALNNHLRQLQNDLDEITKKSSAFEKIHKDKTNLNHCAMILLEARDYDAIDAASTLADIDRLKTEAKVIEQQSTELKELRERHEELRRDLKSQRDKIENLIEESTTCQGNIASQRELRQRCVENLDFIPEADRSARFPALDSLHDEMFVESTNLRNITVRTNEMRERLKGNIDSLDKQIVRLRDSTVKAMQEYRNCHPVETQDVDASIDALPDYQNMLRIIEEDGLPKFVQRFKKELNEKTIQSVVHFQNLLERERGEIQERINQINRSLESIDYNEGTFISLTAKPVADADIREFQMQLRSCTEGAIGGEDLYDEARFLKVKSVIERLRGRPASLDADKRWTKRVTDVRNWYEFAASEIWRSDGNVKEYYEGASGKSGGQKEKLAYTVLASALAYQFDLHGSENRGRVFRFVMIDEAFGKGSDESTRYGLDLFGKLGLQLLIVTPLQKLRVIEDYVSNVHFVHNEGGNNSMLRNMTIEEYQASRHNHEQTLLQESIIRSVASGEPTGAVTH